jgi:hypothetical protein
MIFFTNRCTDNILWNVVSGNMRTKLEEKGAHKADAKRQICSEKCIETNIIEVSMNYLLLGIQHDLSTFLEEGGRAGGRGWLFSGF